MNRFLTTILLLALCFSMKAQKNIKYNAKVQVISVVAGTAGGDYRISGMYIDDLSLYNSTYIKTDTTRFMDFAGSVYLVDTVITYGTMITFEVGELDNNVTPFTGAGKLFEPTPNFQFPLPAGSQTDRQNVSTEHLAYTQMDQLINAAVDGAADGVITDLTIDKTDGIVTITRSIGADIVREISTIIFSVGALSGNATAQWGIDTTNDDLYYRGTDGDWKKYSGIRIEGIYSSQAEAAADGVIPGQFFMYDFNSKEASAGLIARKL